MELTKKDRLFLSNQLRILEALYPDEENYFAIRREAIENGYALCFDIDYDYIYEGEDMMTEEECLEVWDTMEMYASIARARERNPEDTRGLGDAKFSGYDGNNETKFMSFAEYTVQRLGRFRYLELEQNNYFNSHMPMRDKYQRMLDVFKNFELGRRMQLSVDDALTITKAALHPDAR